jgi:hypothetical protein
VTFKTSGIKPGWPQDPTADQDHVQAHESHGLHANGFAKPGQEGAAGVPPSGYYAASDFILKSELQLGDSTAGGTFDLDLYVDKELYRFPFYFKGSAEPAESDFPAFVVGRMDLLFACAQCDPAPTGADVTVQWAFRGDDVLTTPLAIPAGSTPRTRFYTTDFAISQFAPTSPTDEAAWDLYCRIVDVDDPGDTAANISCMICCRRTAV